jgi:hypothetical protein
MISNEYIHKEKIYIFNRKKKGKKSPTKMGKINKEEMSVFLIFYLIDAFFGSSHCQTL